MVRKKSAERKNFAETFRHESPIREEEPMPLQYIDPLAIQVYNPKDVRPIELEISMESNTSDEDQNDNENPNAEENPTTKEVEYEKINVDTFVAELISKA